MGGLTGQCCTSLSFKPALETIEFKDNVMFRVEKEQSIFFLTFLKSCHCWIFFWALLLIEHEKCLSQKGIFNSFSIRKLFLQKMWSPGFCWQAWLFENYQSQLSVYYETVWDQQCTLLLYSCQEQVLLQLFWFLTMMSGIFPVVFIGIFLPLCQAKGMTNWSLSWVKTTSEEKIKF